MTLRHSCLSLLLVAPVLAHAFSFWFTGTPTQCTNMTIQWTNGNPPYRLLLIPTGHVNPETRVIVDQTIQSGNAYSFVLKFPADSSFVATMSDNSGVGSGGTSAVTKVGSSNDKSCLSTTASSPEFFLFANPSTPSQCEPIQLSYSQGAQPPVDILGVIPAGDTFEVAQGSPSNSSFDWTANVKGGTQMMFVAGDTKGAGTGGSSDLLNVQNGNDDSCLANNAPSSTGGTPVGGVSTAASPTQSGSQSMESGNSGQSTPSGSSGKSGSSGSTAPSSAPSGVSQAGASGDPGSGGGTVTGPGGSPVPTGILPAKATSHAKSKIPIIIGAVVGSLCFVAALALAAFVFIRRRRTDGSASSLSDRSSQYTDTDRLAPSPHPWTPTPPPPPFPSFYHAEPFVPPASFTPQAMVARKPTLVAHASSGTRSATAEFAQGRVGEVGKRRSGWWEEEGGAGSEASRAADRGHASSVAPSTVEVPPAYENIHDSREVRLAHASPHSERY